MCFFTAPNLIIKLLALIIYNFLPVRSVADNAGIVHARYIVGGELSQLRLLLGFEVIAVDSVIQFFFVLALALFGAGVKEF